nr:F0F1 ATP synthase subunit gamma [Thiorhodovibrio frisius]
MSDTTASLRRQINSAGDLQSVVRTMKSLAASSIHQYEQSVDALVDYARTVELGLGVCFRGIGKAGGPAAPSRQTASGPIGAVIFGSDQGLVGQFNDRVADHAVQKLAGLAAPLSGAQPAGQLDAGPDAPLDARPDAKKDQSPSQPQVWAVGERVQARLADAGLTVVGQFTVPSSVEAITALVGEILVEIEAHQASGRIRRALPVLQQTQLRCRLRARRPAPAAPGRALAARARRCPLADEQSARGDRGR